MRVLIASDATPRPIEIVNEAASRPWPEGSVFLLLHVLDPFPFGEAPVTLQRAKETVAIQIKSAGDTLVKAGWNVETRVIFGMARKVVSEIAASWKADLVMVGSNEVGALTRLLLGSTARSVLRHAPCSVEIVRLASAKDKVNAPSGLNILVATDGSEYSKAALESVASRPWPLGSRAKVISIPEPFLLLGEFPYLEMTEIENQNVAALEDAKKYAAAGAEILRKAGLETVAETPFPKDSDGREIVSEAERWHADIVVIGSHGRRGFDRMTMGSVSEHVALHAHCSVEVTRVTLAPNGKSKRISKKGEMP